MLNKPKGFVTTLRDERGRRNAAQLVDDCGVRVYPVGRLDMDSEGLLIFTNDGEMANKLMHPKHEVNKTYMVWVRGYTYDNFEKLKQPIVIDGYKIKRPDVQCMRAPDDEKQTAVMQIVIHEGRNRQVRRMCAAAGMRVTKLLRVAEGNLRLGDLKSGCWRYLTEDEIRMLKN
jgi:23S rRNA pseudouridine2605 synthase